MPDDLRDSCCWRSCRAESDIIFYGVGLCDDHHATACATYLPTYNYAVARVVPESADVMREQHQANQTKHKESN